jgi:uncharacterized protein (UPF0261 family)
MSEKTVVLVGTLDTKGAEYKYLRDRLVLGGVKTRRSSSPTSAVVRSRQRRASTSTL